MASFAIHLFVWDTGHVGVRYATFFFDCQICGSIAAAQQTMLQFRITLLTLFSKIRQDLLCSGTALFEMPNIKLCSTQVYCKDCYFFFDGEGHLHIV